MSGVLAKMKTRTPNCSAFPFDFRNKMTNRIGELRPVAVIEMGPNDRCKMSMAQLTRFFPLSAPAMANFQLQVDSVFVPSRIVAKKYEKFFNAGTTDEERPYFPKWRFGEYCSVLVHDVGLFTPGLLDYLGFPTFEEVKVFIRNMVITYVASSSTDYSGYTYFDPSREIYLSEGHWQNLGAIYSATGGSSSSNYFGFDKDGHYISYVPNLGTVYIGIKYNSHLEHLGLIPYLAVKYTGGSSYTVEAADLAMLDFLSSIGIHYTSTNHVTETEILEAFCNANNRHVPDVLDEYFNYFAKSLEYANREFVFEAADITVPSGFVPFLQLVFLGNSGSDVTVFLNNPDNDFTLLPIFSFWKCYFDWYVNSVLEHGEDLTDAWTNFCNGAISFSAYPTSVSDVIGLGGFEESDSVILSNFWGIDPDEDNIWPSLCRIPARLWSVDRFTGAYTDTQNGQAVLIPTDGTIRDLKASNQLQRYLEKALFGGTRTIDKNELIYGAHSSNQLLDRTEVLSRKKFNIDIQQVTNSAASDSFDLGTLAGNGFGMGSNFLFDYTCEERGYIMVFASVVLPPSYVQAVDRNLLHTDYYDFVIPEFDSVGEQEIMPQELYCDKGMSLNPVGYNRRYYEAIDFLSSVHGDLKNSLRHWHDARYFKSTPSLSPEFIRIDPENDDLERIFATYNHDQILHFFAFSGAIVRPMSKYMQFGAL